IPCSRLYSHETPSPADLAVEDSESAVDEHPDDEDHDHQCNELLVVREILSGPQLLSQRTLLTGECVEDELAGHQAAPRESPALFQAADERRQRGGQGHATVEAETPSAHDPADANAKGLDVIRAAHSTNRHRGRAAAGSPATRSATSWGQSADQTRS